MFSYCRVTYRPCKSLGSLHLVLASSTFCLTLTWSTVIYVVSCAVCCPPFDLHVSIHNTSRFPVGSFLAKTAGRRAANPNYLSSSSMRGSAWGAIDMSTTSFGRWGHNMGEAQRLWGRRWWFGHNDCATVTTECDVQCPLLGLSQVADKRTQCPQFTEGYTPSQIH